METEQELQKTIDELRDSNLDLQYEVDDLKTDIVDLESEVREQEEEIRNLESELSEYENQTAAPEFSSLVDQEKYDLFLENYSRFTLEQFEEFLKPYRQ